jgi:hypothetical protein
VPGFRGLEVDELRGDRWELALALLQSGSQPVRYGNVDFWRSTAGPRADGRVAIAIVASTSLSSLNRARVQADVEAGLALIAGAKRDEPRLAALLDEYGSRLDYVLNDGNTIVTLANLDEDGAISWGRWKPRD